MTRMSASKAREKFSDVVNRAGFKGERIALAPKQARYAQFDECGLMQS